MPDGVLRKNWLNFNCSVEELVMEKMKFHQIEDGAFMSHVFKTLTYLAFSKISLQYLNDRTFDGLSSLIHLNLSHIEIIKLDANILTPVRKLEMFSMKFVHSEPMYLDNFFGLANKLPKLRHIEIWRCSNLSDTITKTTFMGLHGVETLILSGNQIQRIGKRSFDVPLKSLIHLELRDNNMTTIPSNLFNVRVRNLVTVYVDNNPWHCDCHMENFRQFLKLRTSIRFNWPLCDTPPEYGGYLISSVPDLCIDPLIALTEMQNPLVMRPPTTESKSKLTLPLPGFTFLPIFEVPENTDSADDGISTEIYGGEMNNWVDKDVRIHEPFTHNTTNQEDENDDEKNNEENNEKKDEKYIALWCEKTNPTELTENVILKLPRARFLLVRQIGSHFHIEIEKASNDLKLLGFEQTPGTNTNSLKCFTNVKTNESIKIIGNLVYRFCGIQNGLKTISLFDCTSFASNTIEEIHAWIMIEHQKIYITVWSLIAFFVLASGTLIGVLLTKYCSKTKVELDLMETAKEKTEPIYATIERIPKPLNDIPQIHVEHETFEELFISEAAPPLPPRNKPNNVHKCKCCSLEICECYYEISGKILCDFEG